MTTKGLTLAVFILLFSTGIANCQEHYYFKPWKGNFFFEQKDIFFLVDTSNSGGANLFLLDLVYHIDKEIKNSAIKCIPLPYPTDTIISNNSLCLLLKYEKMAYVQSKSLGPDKPLCYRINIYQTQPEFKKRINTIVSIDANEQIKGREEFAKEFSQRLLNHFVEK